MTFDKEKKEMIKIRKMVIEKLKNSINNDCAGDALNYMALLKEVPPYIEK